MNISYMISAYTQPAHLHRLVHALNTRNTQFFIHVDKKYDISPFLQYDYPENVTFLKNRTTVFHGGFSQVEAYIELVKTAYHDSEGQYFQFLSGWDYPIKNNQFIQGFMQKNYPINFINFYPLVGDADYVNGVTRYHFIDTVESSPTVLRIPLKILQKGVENLPIYRRFFQGLIPYRGSTWSCLNRETIAYIVNFLETKEGQSFQKYFKFVTCADEIFFQTLVLNSPHASFCRFYQRDIEENSVPMKNENKAYLHYIDWDADRENPAWFDMGDYETLKNSDALYARKFNEEKSAELLAKIDQLTGVYQISPAQFQVSYHK